MLRIRLTTYHAITKTALESVLSCSQRCMTSVHGLPLYQVKRAAQAASLRFLRAPTHVPRRRTRTSSTQPAHRQHLLLWAFSGYIILALCSSLMYRCSARPHSQPSCRAQEGTVMFSMAWLVNFDMVDLDALRAANSDRDFHVLPV